MKAVQQLYVRLSAPLNCIHHICSTVLIYIIDLEHKRLRYILPPARGSRLLLIVLRVEEVDGERLGYDDLLLEVVADPEAGDP